MTLKITLPNRYKEEEVFSEKKIADIVTLSFGSVHPCEFEYEQRDGRYITIEGDGIKKFICISNDTVSGRNSFLVQYFGTVYSRFFLDLTPHKSLEVYFACPPFSATVARYHIFINRITKTLGAKLLNELDIFHITSEPYEHFSDMTEERDTLRGANRSNISSYFLEEKDFVAVYGKSFGANGKEAVTLCHAVRKVTEKPVKLFIVEDNNAQDLPVGDKEALIQAGVDVIGTISPLKREEEFSKPEEEEIRKTARFHYNLVKKYGDKNCYLCDCNIESVIIGAHIHRVTDIRNSEASFEEKIEQTTDADNGLWLCANHDKLFEYGLIYFNCKELKFLRRLSPLQLSFIKEITKKNEIESLHYNERMKRYIQIHAARFVD